MQFLISNSFHSPNLILSSFSLSHFFSSFFKSYSVSTHLFCVVSTSFFKSHFVSLPLTLFLFSLLVSSPLHFSFLIFSSSNVLSPPLSSNLILSPLQKSGLFLFDLFFSCLNSLAMMSLFLATSYHYILSCLLMSHLVSFQVSHVL